MKNVLITGGAGFIGSNLALKLIEKGYNVTVLDNLSQQIHGNDPRKNSSLFRSIENKVNFFEGTVTSKDDWAKALEQQDMVVHLAAETGTGQSMYQIEKYNNVNIGGTAILLDHLTNNKHSISKLIIASSRAIYGEGKYIVPSTGSFVYPEARAEADMMAGNFEVTYQGNDALQLTATDENSKIHPTSVYGITKQVQEQMCMVVGKSINIPTVAFRYQNVYGPGQSLSNPYTGILSIFSSLIRNNQPINIFEDGKESRDFVYIDDVVDATILGIEKEEANYEVFNVGTGRPIDVVTILRALMENYNAETAYSISGNYRLGDIRHNYADLRKIGSKLGFAPKVTFEEGIRRFTDWVKTQQVIKDRYQESIEEMKVKGLFK